MSKSKRISGKGHGGLNRLTENLVSNDSFHCWDDYSDTVQAIPAAENPPAKNGPSPPPTLLLPFLSSYGVLLCSLKSKHLSEIVSDTHQFEFPSNLLKGTQKKTLIAKVIFQMPIDRFDQ